MQRLTIGTRGSALALWQAEHVAERLRTASPILEVELKVIKTRGDKILDVPLAKVGGKGLFVKEIEQAMLRHEIHLAVHSIKDVPALLSPGLILAAIPEREDPRDALVSRAGELDDLPAGAVVGTSSLRRACQLLHRRPDLKLRNLRGNVDTRLGKLDEGQYDAVVLAAAGLNRLGLAGRITERLSPQVMLPAVGQGALGLETRENDNELKSLVVDCLNDPPTATCVGAERAFLARLGGGCQVPVAAHARLVNQEELQLEGLIGHPSGQPHFRHQMVGQKSTPEDLGRRLAEHLLAIGGDKVLQEVCG